MVFECQTDIHLEAGQRLGCVTGIMSLNYLTLVQVKYVYLVILLIMNILMILALEKAIISANRSSFIYTM